MADNRQLNMGYGTWIVYLYNPAMQLELEGELRIDGALWSVMGVDDENQDYCLGVFPSANVGAIHSKEEVKTKAKG
ncbi:hypothetical protein ACI394_27980 [Klebsiella pneumoniae]|uniref:hypothetical protein n=1 Tax=Klebsiella pneumoniae TaxID=573 RepID=UPI00385240E6